MDVSRALLQGFDIFSLCDFEETVLIPVTTHLVCNSVKLLSDKSSI